MKKIKIDKTQFQFLDKDFKTEVTRDEIKHEIKRLENLSKFYYNKQWAEKTVINSSYGALASKYFIGFNIDVASSVTAMGRNIVKYGAQILNKYFLEYWHKDKELHKQLGLLGEPAKMSEAGLRYGDSVDKKSLIEIELPIYELNNYKFSEYSILFVNRNGWLKSIQSNECKDNEDIIYIIDLWKKLKQVL